MKKIIIAFMFVVGFVANALADSFQIYFRESKGERLISGAEIKIFDSQNKIVYKGYADGYGRIIPRIKNGSYTMEVSYYRQRCRTSIVMDGNRAVKKIILSDRSCQ